MRHPGDALRLGAGLATLAVTSVLARTGRPSRFEVDVFWVSVTGNDPVKFIKKLGKRVMLVHLKDKEKGTPVKFAEDVDKSAFKEVGNGVVDIHAVLKAAESVGVEHFFVEQDQSPDPLASLKQSYEFLSKQT